jgi:hypothetical protein
MSRSAFLSAGGDVFLADFTATLWNKYWRDEIDTFYIGYNNHAEVPVSVAHEFVRKWEKDPKVRIIYTPHGIGNGNPITQMLLNSKEDSLLLLEDDSYIYTPDIVNTWFTVVEKNMDLVIGSPRYSVGEVSEAAKRKYVLDYSGVGDKGFGWWPSFFLCKRTDLLKTDLDFGSKKYPKGQYLKELDHEMENDDYTDTFTWTSIQLRYQGLTEFPIPQNHAHPYDLQNVSNKEGMFANGDPKYMHGGSLSSGWGGYLNKKVPPVDTDMQKQDIETRVAFWSIVSDVEGSYDYSFKSVYKKAIENLIMDAQLNRTRIDNKIQLYKRLIHI